MSKTSLVTHFLAEHYGNTLGWVFHGGSHGLEETIKPTEIFGADAFLPIFVAAGLDYGEALGLDLKKMGLRVEPLDPEVENKTLFDEFADLDDMQPVALGCLLVSMGVETVCGARGARQEVQVGPLYEKIIKAREVNAPCDAQRY